MTCRTARPERALLAAASCALASLLAWAVAGLVFSGGIRRLDRSALRWVRDRISDDGATIALARDVTALGNDTTLWIVTLLVSGYLAATGRLRSLGHLVAATALGGLMSSSIKVLVGRPRPTVVPQLVEVHSASFPSGHAMNAAFVFGTLAIIAARGEVHQRAHRYILAAALTLIALIGASRVVLGVHWPSDVLAGWTFGLAWAALAGMVATRLLPDAA